MAALSKSLRQTNSDTPGASRLMATPETVWSALNVTEAMACSSAMSVPAMPAAKKPSQGLPVK